MTNGVAAATRSAPPLMGASDTTTPTISGTNSSDIAVKNLVRVTAASTN